MSSLMLEQRTRNERDELRRELPRALHKTDEELRLDEGLRARAEAAHGWLAAATRFLEHVRSTRAIEARAAVASEEHERRERARRAGQTSGVAATADTAPATAPATVSSAPSDGARAQVAAVERRQPTGGGAAMLPPIGSRAQRQRSRLEAIRRRRDEANARRRVLATK